MTAKGTNVDGYGKVDVCFDVNGNCWELAKEANEKARLQAVFNDTPKFYIARYGNIEDIDKTVRDIIKENKNENNL